jgi:hypothetical protein
MRPRPSARHRRETDAVAPGAVALRLSLGRSLPAGEIDWTAALRVAVGERLAAVVWHRNGTLLRAAAPPSVVDAWRTHAIAVDQRGRDRLRLLATVAGALSEASIPTVVLKGMALAQRLYGNPFVRASDDIDLYVERSARRGARQVLLDHGWHHENGAPPWDELFSRGPRTMLYLELHEMLVTDYLAHLRLPAPHTAPIDLDGVGVRALDDPIEPAYLAAHLAGHQLPPLLWVVDFHTLWGGMTDAERAVAQRAARGAGLHRYLAWATQQAAAIDLAAEGDRAAIARLGIHDGHRRDDHLSIWRHTRLAPTPLDAGRVFAACVWPRPLRGSLRSALGVAAWRLRRRLGALNSTRGDSSGVVTRPRTPSTALTHPPGRG